MTELIMQSLYSGLLQGGSYALIALGLALVFGAMKVINLAHGELVLLAAYIGYTVESKLGVNPLLAIPMAVVLVTLASAGIYLLVGRIKTNREINSLTLTYGVGVILTNLALLIWSADVRATGSSWMQEAFVLGPLYSMRSEVLFFGVSVVLIGGLWWWLSRSWYGRAVRAVSSNRDAAKLMGINPGFTELVSFIVAGIMAAKRTSELIPLCHPLPLTKVSIDLTVQPEGVVAAATVATAGRTGVEMEALTAVSTALLTVYDMAKALDKRMTIEGIRLLRKTGGKSGHFTA